MSLDQPDCIEKMDSTAEAHARQKERDLNSLYVMALVLTLGIVTVTFFALVFAFFYRSNLQKNWLPIELPHILWVSTGVLAASSAALVVAQRRVKAGDEAGCHRAVRVTVALGLAFMVLQLVAWFEILRTGVALQSNPHESFIFLFSGAHGVHILVGLAGLFYLLNRTKEPVSGPKYRMMTRVWTNSISIFWHYLGLVWIALYATLLFWKR